MEININKVKIVHHNVQSWKTNKMALRNIYTKINADVITINSHGCKTNEEMKIYGFTVYKKNTRQEGHSGRAIAVRNRLVHRVNEEYEGDFMSIELETDYGVVEIATDYVPPRVGYIDYPTYYRFFKKKHSTYLLADLNARHGILGYQSATNTQGKQVAALIIRKHAIKLGPHFSTFLTYRSATSPDIILTNKRHFMNSHSEPGPITPSDHIPIIFSLSTSPIQVPIIERPSYKKADWDLYKEKLEEAEIYDEEDMTPLRLNNLADQWTKAIETASQLAIPVIKRRTLIHMKDTEELKRLKITYRATITQINTQGPNWDLYRNITSLRNRIRTIYKEETTRAWNEAIDRVDVTRNPRDFWGLIKRLTAKPLTKAPNYLKDHNGNKIYNSTEREIIFREHWEKVFNISQEENQEFEPYMDELVGRSLNINRNINSVLEQIDITENIPPITKGAVKHIIQNSKQRAPGLDKITRAHMMNLPDKMLKNLVVIYNAAMKLGNYPERWKTAKVIFLPKPHKSPYSHINYRPISLLSVPGKIFEKLINNRLVHHLKTNNLLHRDQHGFRGEEEQKQR